MIKWKAVSFEYDEAFHFYLYDECCFGRHNKTPLLYERGFACMENTVCIPGKEQT